MLVTVAHSVSTLTPFLSVSSRFDAGSTRNLRLRTLYLQLRAMGSNKGGESLNQSISINDPSGDDAAKENGTGDQNAALSMAAKYESMTVQELRTMLGNFGASAKGRKSELISRLSSLSDGNVSGETFLKLDRVTDVEASSVKKCKRKQQPLVDDDETEEVDVDDVVTNLKTVAKTTKVSGKSLPAKRKLSGKATTTTAEATVVLEESVYESEPWTRFAHKKPLKDWFAYNPKVMRPPHLGSDVKCMKLISWNVNGLRALLKMEGFSALELAQREDFDILCLQETKLQDKDVESVKHMLEGYDNSFWTCSVSKRGYSGTAIISRVKPLSVSYGLGISDHDSEGRLVTAEYESFYLLSAYVPNSGDGLKRLPYRVEQWDPSLSSHIKELEKSKPVILTGDLNCAHQEIDIYNPAGNKRSAGFTMEERQSFETNFLAKGFVDTFRKQHPNAVGYTYWGYRHGGRKTNRGWRLDYFLVSQSMADNVHDSYILPDVNGSDHCPIGLVLRL